MIIHPLPTVDYDKVNKINHIYTIDSISDLLSKSGFSLSDYTYSYGWIGRFAYEIMTLGIYTIQLVPLFFSILFILIYGLGIHPVMLFLMFIDYLLPKKSGNGLF